MPTEDECHGEKAKEIRSNLMTIFKCAAVTFRYTRGTNIILCFPNQESLDKDMTKLVAEVKAAHALTSLDYDSTINSVEFVLSEEIKATKKRRNEYKSIITAKEQAVEQISGQLTSTNELTCITTCMQKIDSYIECVPVNIIETTPLITYPGMSLFEIPQTEGYNANSGMVEASSIKQTLKFDSSMQQSEAITALTTNATIKMEELAPIVA